MDLLTTTFPYDRLSCRRKWNGLSAKGQTLDRRKVTLTLSGEAVAILESVATERKRGEFVSNLLVEWAENQTPKNEPGILESIVAGVRRIEKQLADNG